jgi:hypothetical protein
MGTATGVSLTVPGTERLQSAAGAIGDQLRDALARAVTMFNGLRDKLSPEALGLRETITELRGLVGMRVNREDVVAAGAAVQMPRLLRSLVTARVVEINEAGRLIRTSAATISANMVKASEVVGAGMTRVRKAIDDRFRLGKEIGRFALQQAPQFVQNAAGAISSGAPPHIALAMAGAMEVLGPMMERLAPVVGALVEPLAIIGEMMAVSIIPVLKLLAGPMRVLALATTYVQEAFGRIIRVIGRMLDALNPFGGNSPLTRWGDAMIDSAEEARRKIGALDFDSAANGLNQLARAAVNAVEGLKVGQYAYAATIGRAAAAPRPPLPPPPTPPDGRGTTRVDEGRGAIVQGGNTTWVFQSAESESADDMYARWYRGAESAAASDPRARATLASMPRPRFA